MKRYIGQGVGEGLGASMLSLASAPSQCLRVFPDLEAVQIPGMFMEASLRSKRLVKLLAIGN